MKVSLFGEGEYEDTHAMKLNIYRYEHAGRTI